MRCGVVIFPGSNCDYDCYYLLKNTMKLDTRFIWHKELVDSSYDLIVLPGGFSYGDYLRAGAIASCSPIMSSIREFAQSGGTIVGICNGFQVLLEAGLLPGALTRNRNLKFICQEVTIRVENPDSKFTRLYKKGELLNIPIAHADGNYFADTETIEELRRNNQIIFRYASPGGSTSDDSNPNGSIDNIAGICNREGNILGMMPHPERVMGTSMTNEDGLKLFKSILSSGRVAV